VREQEAEPGWLDEDGLWWCVQGGNAAIRPAWFRALVSVMSAADRIQALRRHEFAVAVDDFGGWIEARHASGFRLVGGSSLLTAALCHWEHYDPQFASSAAQHARQQEAFQHAYKKVQAVGHAELGEPTMQGRDHDEFRHRWSAWRIGEVLLAVHQAVGDVQFGLSLQIDARRYPSNAALDPQSPFLDWMWRIP
jgi:hypothetical protein